MSPDLTDQEIDDICDGYKQNAAKVRFLKSLGVTVERKPNGRPLVNRAHYESVRGAPRPPPVDAVPFGPGPRWKTAA
jgi:hypothetical protein